MSVKIHFSTFVDKQYIVKKCPYLINEMVNIVAQLVALAHGGRGKVIIFMWNIFKFVYNSRDASRAQTCDILAKYFACPHFIQLHGLKYPTH